MHDHWFSVFSDKFTPTAAYAATTWNLSQIVNFRLVLCFAVFLLLYLAFLVVLPGIREKRVISFVTVSIQLAIGAMLIGSIILPYWKVGEAEIVTHFQAHSKQKHQAELGVWVGLRTLNITLKYIRTADSAEKVYRRLYLNERFNLGGVSMMVDELHGAYLNGLPYPVLKTLEYFSLSQGAFVWGHQFRNAGHYSNAMLWTAFAVWLFQCLLLALVPHHFSKIGILCGIFALIADLLYVQLSPADLNIPFASVDGSTTFVQLHYGACFYMSILAGLLSIVFGAALSVLQFFRLYTITTFLSSNLDDTVGPKCRYGGGRNNKIQWGGVEAAESCSASSHGTSSSASTTDKSESSSYLSSNDGTTTTTGDRSARATETLSIAVTNASAISPTSSSSSISPSYKKLPLHRHFKIGPKADACRALDHLKVGPKFSETSGGGGGGKSLDILRTMERAMAIDHKQTPSSSSSPAVGESSSGFHSSLSVCSVDSTEEQCRMTDDDEEQQHEQRRHQPRFQKFLHIPGDHRRNNSKNDADSEDGRKSFGFGSRLSKAPS